MTLGYGKEWVINIVMLKMRCNNALCIMNTLFQQKDLHNYTLCKVSLGQRSLTDFCVIWDKMLQSVLGVCIHQAP